MGARKRPYAFTEQGVAMLSGVLKSPTAVEVNIQIMRAFVSMRHFMMNNAAIFQRLETIEFNQLESNKAQAKVLAHQEVQDHRIDELFRRLDEGGVITVEPWRSAGFPIIKDCMVDRSAFDKIIQAGGYTSIRIGQAQDANAILIPKENADEAMDCATCIGRGACVAACKNGSAMLFVSSKVSQLALLPQGRVEAAARAKKMIARMDELGFGTCTNTRACEAVCPKNESIANIARLNREFLKAKLAD